MRSSYKIFWVLPNFEWIKIFDNNTYGIIAIMILVAGINMITALLVLILERTQMIGILKALGSANWSIRKIFLYNASYLIGLGLFPVKCLTWRNTLPDRAKAQIAFLVETSPAKCEPGIKSVRSPVRR